MKTPWFRAPWIVGLSGFLVPPVGLGLVWSGASKLRSKLTWTVLISLLTIGHLMVFWKMRFELDGTGSRPLVRFGDADSRYEKLTKSREQQQKSAPVPEAPVPVADAKPEPQVVAAVQEEKPVSPIEPWSSFRGAGRDGVYREGPLLTKWPEIGPKQLWTQPIGGGYASFVVGDGRAYTIEQRKGNEAVTAYDLMTGRELWAHTYAADFRESMGGDGPRATPTYHDGRVYSIGALGDFHVLEARTGKVIWKKNIISENGGENLQWGMAGSPLIVGNTVIVQPGAKGASVVAYTLDSGKVVWKSLDDKQAYVTPMLVTLDGKDQILTITATRAVGLDAKSGKLLWSFPWETEYDVNAAMPIVVGKNSFYISSGYGHGAALIEVNGGQARAVWSNNRMKNKFNHAVLFENHIYGFDEAIFACMDVRTGALKWKGGRYGYGQVLLAGSNLIITTEAGEIALVRANPEKHEELARIPAITGKTWNVPALASGILLVRNADEMAAYDLRVQ